MATGRVPPPVPGQAALYVGDLHPEVTEAMIFEELKEAGPIVSIRVCRDSVTRKSLGYAYVNFQTSADAENCLETMNYTPFKGRPCRIMWSQRNPTLRKSNKANIFIKSLHSAIDNKALFDTFSAFGAILSCKVVLKPNGESAGYGFVHFETEEAARMAVEKVNGMLLNSKQVYVGYFERRSTRLELHKQKFTNIYIKHLKPEVNKEKLDETFSKFGVIRSSLVSAKEDGTSKGFAFVNYEEHDSAVKAIEELHDTTAEQNDITLPNKTLYVARHQRKSERQHLREQWAKERQQRLAKYVNLYIKNLDDTIDDDKLREYFEPFGTIISAKVMRDDQSGASRGFGFVSFRDAEAANKATAEMNGKIGVSSKPLYVGPAQRKEERRLQLEMQFAQRTKAGLFQGSVMQSAPPAGGMQQQYVPQAFNPNPTAPPNFPMGQAQASFFQQMQGARPSGPRWNSEQAMGRMAVPPAQGPRGRVPAGLGGPMGVPPGAPPPGRGAFNTPVYPQPKPSPYLPQAIPSQLKSTALPRGAFPPQATATAVPPVPEDLPLTPALLAKMTLTQQKNALGEKLFTSISHVHPDLAAKITGMLLEMEATEILGLLQQPDLLGAKVSEALEVLKKHPDELQAAKVGE